MKHLDYDNYTVVDGNDELFSEKHGFKEIEYEELVKLYQDDPYIPYAQYLRTNLWRTKRLEILERDNFRCQKCHGYETTTFIKKIKSTQGIVKESILMWSSLIAISWTDLSGQDRFSVLKRPEGEPDKPYNLQVHHKKYYINRLPWDYDNDDLITLCNYCHTEEHEKSKIMIFNENKIIEYNNCDRCGGTGYFPEYKHVKGGVCFKCHGERFNVKLIDRLL